MVSHESTNDLIEEIMSELQGGQGSASSHCSSSGRTLILGLRALARDVQCGDGVANAAILEASQRLEALSNAIEDIRDSALVVARRSADYLSTMLDELRRR